jgi:IMP dehydrogenase/GMP reductase
MKKTKFDLDDITLMPSEVTYIEHRNDCNILYNNINNSLYDKRLPLIASPMDTVVSEENYMKYISNGIISCLPRGLSSKHLINNQYYFQAFGLKEIEDIIEIHEKTEINTNYPVINNIINDYNFLGYPHILIDIANGHMERLANSIKKIKKYCPSVILMVGNVANPETFINLALLGVDMVRISIGSGAGCTTGANVAINYPLGSLISECYKLKQEYKLSTKIVADGGMKNFADIIKALALGADYIMIGSIFNKSIESAGFNYIHGIRINNKIAKFLWSYGFPIKKKYRGMSTKAVQRSWGKTKLVTAEGITKYQKVEYTLDEWVENFSDYLKSAMSYCNAKNLEEFIGKADYVFITESAKKRFLK